MSLTFPAQELGTPFPSPLWKKIEKRSDKLDWAVGSPLLQSSLQQKALVQTRLFPLATKKQVISTPGEAWWDYSVSLLMAVLWPSV